MRARRREGDRQRGAIRAAIVVAALTVTVGLALLAAVVPMSADPADPPVLGERYDSADPGTLGPDGTGDTSAVVDWIDVGERFRVRTYASSSCPLAPTAMGVEDGALRVTMTSIGGPACTTDFGPTDWALVVPPGLPADSDVEVRLELPDGRSIRRTLER
ncbi:hypothetical protein ABID70_001622 [Clavibacter michiganensis]|uniref:hypothetical protein n=1 Tax=Clavibacter michiganensis TaxID=28447 RepID=UPI001AE311F1|nr:hypothetical protein [Clavibacter michiganensis]MBP2459054.1 hypothetical protein [Clavibacter michiganensis]MDQ0411626.1 hypothetical protein [Clavibacter michiganensis]